ncbi:hypothetical protein HN713_02770 [bacterium]|nr:hypothetical protein [bacterium]
MKNLFSVSASRQIGTKHIFRIGSIDSGRAATKEMAAQPDPVPVDLTNYFAKVKKGEYFSITKRTEMKANPEAKKGVAALQQVLKDGGLFDAAEAELKNADSEFRKAIEKIEAVAGKKLFGYSLAAFDKNQKLSQSSDGDYGHSTRLGVAYLQWKYGAKVDGAFGSETMALIKKEALEKKFLNEKDEQAQLDLLKLRIAVGESVSKEKKETTTKTPAETPEECEAREAEEQRLQKEAEKMQKEEEEKDVEKAEKEKEKAVASKVKTFVEDDLRPGQCEKVETITFDGGKVLIGKERNPDKFATWDRSVVDSTDVYKNRDDELKQVIIEALKERAGE